MKLVTTTHLLTRRFGWEKTLDILKDAGFDAYDHLMYVSYEDMDTILSDEYAEKIKALKAHADKIGLPCTQVHAPFDDNQIGLTPAIIKVLEYASILDAEVVVVHPQTDNFKYYERKDELFKLNMEYYKNLIPYAEKYNVKIAIENMFGWDRDRLHNTENVCSHYPEFIQYVDAVESPYITACVDIGHCQIVHEAPENMLMKMGSRVGALHVHDNTGFDDAHNIPFSGTVNWDNVCKALADIDYKGNFTFESHRFFNQYMDDEHVINAVKYLEQVGRCLIRKIESYK